MKKLLLGLLLALASISASADAVLDIPPNQIILRDEAGCPFAEVRDLIVESELGRFHPARVLFEGRVLKACWTEESGAILMIDEDGDAAMFPMQVFKPYKGT